MSISAMKQALMQLNRDDVYLGHRSKTRADAIAVLRQAIAEAEKQPVHASDMSQKPVDETVKDRHETDDDIYDVWVEQGTCQQNRQVAKKATTSHKAPSIDY